MTQARNSLIAQNSLLNFGGQLIPLAVGVLAIPPVVHGMGSESFGILSLAWMLLGYFTVFDLGMGRATTKFISEQIRNGSPQDIRSIFWTSCWMNVFLGLAGGIIMASISTLLAERVFKISPALVHAASVAFIILAASSPVVLVSTAFRGTLEAAQRFDYVNAVAVVSSSLNFLLPLIGFYAGLDVRGIVLLLMIGRVCSASAYFLLCLKVFPVLKGKISPDFERIRGLLRYGGWVSVSNIVNPVLTYLDRFLIGSMISVAAVTYYSAPYEMVSRVSIVPASMAMTLFPSFSAVRSTERGSLGGLFNRSTKFLVILLGPLAAVLIFLAGDLLRLWLGPQFAEISTGVVQLLMIGILMNALAQVPYALLQGLGRPDITAKFHLLELLVYLPLAWFLVGNMGIIGAALAWTIRVTVDSMLLFAASFRFMSFRAFLANRMVRCFILVVPVIGASYGLSLVGGTLLVKLMVSAGAMLLYAMASWRYVFDLGERELITATAREAITLNAYKR